MPVNKNPRDIIIEPVLSEKAYGLLELNKYTFVVDKRASKTEIKIAIETIFDVHVTNVNTLNRPGKRKRRGYVVGKRPDTKRAIVTLAEGDEIDIFDAGL